MEEALPCPDILVKSTKAYDDGLDLLLDDSWESVANTWDLVRWWSGFCLVTVFAGITHLLWYALVLMVRLISLQAKRTCFMHPRRGVQTRPHTLHQLSLWFHPGFFPD